MPKTTRKEIYKKIATQLEKNLHDNGTGYNTRELSLKTGFKWEAVRNALEALKATGIVIKEGRKYRWDVVKVEEIENATRAYRQARKDYEDYIDKLEKRLLRLKTIRKCMICDSKIEFQKGREKKTKED